MDDKTPPPFPPPSPAGQLSREPSWVGNVPTTAGALSQLRGGSGSDPDRGGGALTQTTEPCPAPLRGGACRSRPLHQRKAPEPELAPLPLSTLCCPRSPTSCCLERLSSDRLNEVKTDSYPVLFDLLHQHMVIKDVAQLCGGTLSLFCCQGTGRVVQKQSYI